MKVWLVSRGDYADREVVAVFAEEADAQAHADAINALPENGWRGKDEEDAGIEELDLFPAGHVPAGRVLFTVTVNLAVGRFSPRIEQRTIWDYERFDRPLPYGPDCHWIELGPGYGDIRAGRWDDTAEVTRLVRERYDRFQTDGVPDYGNTRR